MPKRQCSKLERAFQDYLNCGGFPEAQGLAERDRISLLQGYVDTVVFRDVVERHGITNVVALRQLVRQLLGAAAGLFSVHRFYNDLRSQGVAVAKDAFHQMLGHLEDAFLVRLVSLATTSERQRQSNARKVYPIDPAIIPAFDRSGKANTGHLLEQWFYETAVLLRDLLAEDGSIYVHWDWHVAHYAKCVLDEIFGHDAFVNEIIWRRTGAHNDPGRFGNIHDVIFFFKKGQNYTWNHQFVPHSDDSIQTSFSYAENAGGKIIRLKKGESPPAGYRRLKCWKNAPSSRAIFIFSNWQR